MEKIVRKYKSESREKFEKNGQAEELVNKKHFGGGTVKTCNRNETLKMGGHIVRMPQSRRKKKNQ